VEKEEKEWLLSEELQGASLMFSNFTEFGTFQQEYEDNRSLISDSSHEHEDLLLLGEQHKYYE